MPLRDADKRKPGPKRSWFAVRNRGGSIIDIALIAALIPFAGLLIFALVILHFARSRKAVKIEMSALGINVKLQSDGEGHELLTSSVNRPHLDTKD